MSDAAESELEGDVSPKLGGGVIRYRIWPAKRHPLRLAAAAVLVVGATAGAVVVFEGLYWALIVFLGLTTAAAPFFFPTQVGLDGPSVHLRALGTPRTWDLRDFSRLEVGSTGLHRVELLQRARLSPMDTLEGVIVPLPADKATSDAVLVHLRRWVGRRPTGRFALDIDHTPEDSIDPER